MNAQPPLRPTALLNFKKTDDALAVLIANFWQMTWAKKDPFGETNPDVATGVRS